MRYIKVKVHADEKKNKIVQKAQDAYEIWVKAGYAKYGSDESYWSGDYNEMFGTDNYKGQLGMLVRF